MDFRTFLIEVRLKDYHGIFVGRLQPPTKGHESVINSMIKKGFRTVNVALSVNHGDAKNPLSVMDRSLVLKNVWSKIAVAGIQTNVIFGMYLPEHDATIRKAFKIKDNAPLVLVLGKEDDRFGAISKRPQFFVVNKNEEPSASSPAGILGIKLKKRESKDDFKISATSVRDAIHEGDDQIAMDIMIGNDSVKKKTIAKIRKVGK